MIDAWREWLYPLGLIPALAFSLRFLLQWLWSEREKKSVVKELFWKISLSGNLFLLLHALIQLQFHIGLIQGCNAVISWRNLNLMQPVAKQIKLSTVLWLLTLTLAFIPLLFILQFHLFSAGTGEWFRSPSSAWHTAYVDTGWRQLAWHGVGFAGLLLFNSRFWIQWWYTERCGVSALTPLFWWMSLSGAVLCISYFLHIGDLLNLAGPLTGLIPYIRNLMIIAHTKKQSCPQITS